MDSAATIATLRTAARALTMGSDSEAVRAIQAAQDALDAAKADRLASMDETRAYELDGASTLNTWVRNELRLSTRQTADLVRASSTLTYLPSVAEAAASGAIRIEHVAAFTYGIKHIGAGKIIDAEPWLLEVARTCAPLELLRVVRALREAVFPDDLDKAWAEGMDRQDIQVVPVPDGWHVTGFLSVAIGAKFKAVLDSVTKPIDADDRRPGSERRVDGFDTVLTKILEGGLPSDKGVRPHLSITFDTATDTPAKLAGYGSIGPRLLDYLSCGTDITPIHTRNGQVLDVGRTQRLATLRQRRAITARQDDECAAPGCRKHPPRDPSRHLVVKGRQNRPRPVNRPLQQVPSPRASRAADRQRQCAPRIPVRQP
jgi:hypothetical protein